MKSLKFIFIFNFIISSSFSQIEIKTDFNFGFENTNKKSILPDNWVVWGTGGYSIKTDSSIKHSGKNSILIESEENKVNNSFGGCGYKIPANYVGSQIEVRAYLKLKDVTNGEIGLILRIDGNAGVLKFDNMQQKNIQGTSDWTLYSVKLSLPQNAKNIFIGAMLNGTGKLWVDDFQLLIDEEDISKAKLKNQPILKADTDSAFINGSNISAINLVSSKIEDLAILGKVWGFLKYYHPAITKGDYNWDNELFRIMPKIIDCKDKNERNKILVKWILNLGKIQNDTTNQIINFKIKSYPDITWISDKSKLGGELTNVLLQIKTAIRANKSYYVELEPHIGNPVFNERPYYNLTKPDAGYRLLSLYRYWNIIQYFYPDKNLIDENWNTILEKFIPLFINVRNELEYRLAVLSLISHIHDSHANIWSYDTVLEHYKGKNYAPIEISFIENKAVVTSCFQNELGTIMGIQKGDIIKNINGKNVNTIIKEKLPYTPASNYPSQLRIIATDLIRTNDSILRIIYYRKKRFYKTEIHCVSSQMFNIYSKHSKDKDTCFKYLGPDIAYIYSGTFKNNYLSELIPYLSKTKGLIIDMRCYPSDFIVYTLGRYLNNGITPFVKFSIGNIETPGLFTYKEPLSVGDEIGNSEHYNGRVVILVNENTQSQAEYTTMAFRAAKNVIVIGSTTAGADGNVSEITLPGGIKTMISGIGVYYPDGRETQRIGIIPDIEIKPTIKGISDGRDEILQKAIEIIKKNGSIK